MLVKCLRLLFSLLLAVLFVNTLSAQTADIRGFVYDGDSGEPILFTNVYLEGTTMGATTDIEGLYAISKVPAGDYTLVSTYVGYDTARVAITLKAGQILNQKLYISASGIMLDAIEISAAKEEAKTEVRMSSIKVSPKQIEKIPSVGGEPDLAQYLQVIPGVVFTGDQGGQLYIRGGSPIQTKMMLDGITVYNPFHSIGLFSIFETEIIKNVDVMTGGFGAEHGGRISAVVDVTTKDGNKSELAGKVAASPFMVKGILEGPIVKLNEEGTSMSYVLAAKHSYLDQTSKTLYEYIDTAGLPFKFTDFYGKVSLNSNNGSKLSLSGYRQSDQVDYRGSSLFGWDAFGGGTNFIIVPGQSKVIINGHFSYSKYDMELIEADNKPRTSSIGGFNLDLVFSYFLRNGDIKYGINVGGFATTFDFFNSLGLKIDQNENTTELGGFFKYKGILANGKLLIEPGLRLNYYASLSDWGFEPRFGLKYNMTDKIRFKAATGIYTQNFISTKSDQDVVNLFTGFLSAPEERLLQINGEKANNNLQTAYHLIGGVEIDPTKSLKFNVEAYYKGFPQLININRDKLFPTDPDYTIEEGDAYGIDFLAKYDFKNWYVWGVYSYSFVNRDNGNQIYPPHFDRRHNLNFLGAYTFGPALNWEFSVRWNLGSGFPFTKTQGFYEELSFDNGLNTDLNSQNGNLGVLYEEELNRGQLPYYHRMDLSLKKSWVLFGDSQLEAIASATNVYDRANIFYFDRIRYERVDQLPFLPSLGVSLSF